MTSSIAIVPVTFGPNQEHFSLQSLEMGKSKTIKWYFMKLKLHKSRNGRIRMGKTVIDDGILLTGYIKVIRDDSFSVLNHLKMLSMPRSFNCTFKTHPNNRGWLHKIHEIMVLNLRWCLKMFVNMDIYWRLADINDRVCGHCWENMFDENWFSSSRRFNGSTNGPGMAIIEISFTTSTWLVATDVWNIVTKTVLNQMYAFAARWQVSQRHLYRPPNVVEMSTS